MQKWNVDMHRIYRVLVLVLVSSLLGGCMSFVGGPCTYSTTPGTAVFTEIYREGSLTYAKFDFVPDVAERETDWKWRAKSNIGITTSFVEPRDSAPHLADYTALKVGAIVPVLRERITSGSCTPQKFIFSSLKPLAGWAE